MDSPNDEYRLMMLSRDPAGAKYQERMGLLTYPGFNAPSRPDDQWQMRTFVKASRKKKPCMRELQQRVLSRIHTVFQGRLYAHIRSWLQR